MTFLQTPIKLLSRSHLSYGPVHDFDFIRKRLRFLNKPNQNTEKNIQFFLWDIVNQTF